MNRFFRYALPAVWLSVTTLAGYSGELSLFDAIRNNNRDEILKQLEQGADADVAGPDGTSLLHWAAHLDDQEIAGRLLEAGANPDRANEYGVTPLWLACTNKSDRMVELLLNHGADPNPVLWTGETALMNCARTGASGAVLSLLNSGKNNPGARESKRGQNALMWAAAGGHALIVQLLIEHGAEINAVSYSGFSALMFAARSGELETAQLLIKAGANPDDSTPGHGNTLVVASAGGHEALALYLLEMGANPDSADQYGITSLHYAIRSGMSALNGVRYDSVYRVRPDNMRDLVRAVLAAGANVNARIRTNRRLGPDGSPFNMQGATPYFLAAVSADVALMQMLRDYGANPQLTAEGGITPLIAAARSACTGSCVFMAGGNNASDQDVELAYQAVKAIVEAGVDVNSADDNGLTAMHMAAYTGADKVVQYLAEQGAMVNVRSRFGETPWSMASGISPVISFRGLYGDHKGTVSLLEQLGAVRISREEMDPDAPAPPGQ